MQGPGDLGELQTRDWHRLQALADQLEDAWEGGETPELSRFLPTARDPLRKTALPELVKTDLEIRWRRGQLVGLEFYLEKFPELGTERTVSPEMIYEEYRVRQLYGDRPPLEKYQARFPQQFERLQMLLEQSPLPTAKPKPPAPPASVSDVENTPTRVSPIPGAAPTPPPAPPPPPPSHSGTDSGKGSTVQEQLISVGGGYKKIKRIGSGSFGEVWKAEAPGGVEVALKIILRPLDHEEAQREKQSLELIQQLRHPYLAATHSHWALEDRLYIVMELAEGSVRDRVKQCRASGLPGLPLSELFTYFNESAEALDFLHSKHVQHRDVKPENILILQGHAKVADFGLAKMMESQRLVASATSSGTPAYMAPEVWRGQVSEHSDQYSLACAYAELRLNRRLFEASDMIGIMMGHIEKTPDLNPLGEEEQRILLRAMAKDPAERFPSCKEFMRAIQKALGPELRRSNPNLALELGDAVGDAGPSGYGTMSLGSGERMSRPGSKTAISPEHMSAGWKPPPKQRLWFGVGAGLVATAAIAFIIWSDFLQPGTVTLELPPSVTVPADGTATVPLLIRRDRANGEVKFTFRDVPDKVRVVPDAVTIPPGKSAAEVQLQVADDAEPGPRSLVIVGDSGEQKLEFQVAPLATLPAGFTPVGNKIVTAPATGKKYYEAIRVMKGNIPVEFRVIPQAKGSSLETFYIMKTKVWNRLFKEFADSNPSALSENTEWEQGGIAEGKKALGVTGHDNWPVLRVNVEEADRFARWLGGLLPMPDQWERAAGCFDKQEGPFAGKGPFDPKADPPEVAVLRMKEGPIDVGTATRDESHFGIRDVAGNGQEWTRLTASSGKQVPLESKPKAQDVFVYTRGKSYLSDQEPEKYVSSKSIEALSGSCDYLVASPEIGFRVVIEPR